MFLVQVVRYGSRKDRSCLFLGSVHTEGLGLGEGEAELE